MILPFNASWQDMSDYVVHFTKPTQSGSDYDNIMSICFHRVVRAVNPFGIARKEAPPNQPQNVACFSETPLHHLQRLEKKYGRFAIGFKKKFLVSQGGGPIMYAYKGTPHFTALRELIQQAKKTQSEHEPIWKVAPFIDAPGNYGKAKYFFEWEREWRKIGDLHFSVGDVAFLIIPEVKHAIARQFFEDAEAENSGPAYLCPYLDITWGADKIAAILGAGDNNTS